MSSTITWSIRRRVAWCVVGGRCQLWASMECVLAGAGSLWANEPPIVPRLRTAGSPIMPAIAARAGMPALTIGERLTSAWRVIAPITTPSPSSVMPTNDEIAPRSTRSDGFARRSFNVRIKIIPPSTSFASSAASNPAAASRLAGLWYSNSYIGPLLFRGHRRLMLLDYSPQFLRRRRHFDVLDAEALQCVDDRIGDRCRGADRAGLAAAFDAERVVGAQRHVRRQAELRQIV